MGINPGLRSAEVGHNFARPGNRFYPALHAAGFTPRLLAPEEDVDLPAYGVGDHEHRLAAHPRRGQLSREELRAGAAELEALVANVQPRLVAILGLTAYRTAFGRAKATMGLQEDTIGGRPVWILPNPSGLNAHYKPADFARLYAEARAYAPRALRLPPRARAESETGELCRARRRTSRQDRPSLTSAGAPMITAVATSTAWRMIP